jgi:hypothetical protein
MRSRSVRCSGTLSGRAVSAPRPWVPARLPEPGAGSRR